MPNLAEQVALELAARFASIFSAHLVGMAALTVQPMADYLE
jgi:hypothetical protein